MGLENREKNVAAGVGGIIDLYMPFHSCPKYKLNMPFTCHSFVPAMNFAGIQPGRVSGCPSKTVAGIIVVIDQ